MTDAQAALANQLYVLVVNPDLAWWDDLDPEMQAGWLRAAGYVSGLLAEAAAQERERLRAEGWRPPHVHAFTGIGLKPRPNDRCVGEPCNRLYGDLAQPEP
jgi:hypothetical protein